MTPTILERLVVGSLVLHLGSFALLYVLAVYVRALDASIRRLEISLPGQRPACKRVESWHVETEKSGTTT